MRTNKCFIVLAGFLFFHNTVYLCQGIINALPIRLPESLGETGILILMSIFLFLVIKLTATWIKNLRIHKSFESSSIRIASIEKLGNILDLHNKIIVCQNDYPLAFCFGFINPRIYLSSGLIKILSKTELEAVLRHEKHHLNSKDALVGFFATITQTLFPFFPIITDIARNYRIQNEIAADKSAITAMRDSRPLVSVLRKIITYKPIKPFAFTTSLSEWDSLEIRIKKLVKKEVSNSKIPIRNILVSLFSLIVLGALTLTPTYAIEFHDKGVDTVVFCTSNQSCINICESRDTESFSHN